MALLKKSLRGRRIAVLVADGFEAVELRVPVAALRSAGARVDIVSLHAGKVRGMNLTEPAGTVTVDARLADVSSSDYDGLFVPGGFVNPDLLRQSRDARSFVQAFDAAGKPIATLCHGPWLLASAELLPGRRVTSWPGIRDDLVHGGATWIDDAVVRDGNWVTSRGPEDLRSFVAAILELFAEHAPISAPASDVVVSPSSPRRDLPPAWALGGARVLPSPISSWVLGFGAAAVVFGAWRAAMR